VEKLIYVLDFIGLSVFRLRKNTIVILCSKNSVRERGRRERKTFCAKVKKSRFVFVNVSV